MPRVVGWVAAVGFGLGLSLSSAATTAESAQGATDPLDDWHTAVLASSPYGQSFYPVALYNSGFLTQGPQTDWNASALESSTDGVSWTPSLSLFMTKAASAIGYANGTYVLGFSNGQIMTSADGKAWTSRASKTTLELAAVAYGNGTWVFKSAGGVIYSKDLVNWTFVPFHQTNCITGGVTYGNGLFVATSGYGTIGEIQTSPDGVTWTSRMQGPGFNTVAQGLGGSFVAVGDGGAIATSPDGITWTTRALPNPANDPGFNVNLNLRGVAYGAAGWIAVGSKLTTPVMFLSLDGVTWTQRTARLPNAILYNIGYNNQAGAYVVTGTTNGQLLAFTASGYVKQPLPGTVHVAPGLAGKLSPLPH